MNKINDRQYNILIPDIPGRNFNVKCPIAKSNYAIIVYNAPIRALFLHLLSKFSNFYVTNNMIGCAKYNFI